MEKYARETNDIISAEILSIQRPFSLFDFVERTFPFLPTLMNPVKRILSQVRQHQGKTLILEAIENATDLSEENEDLNIRLRGAVESKSYRLSFFKKEVHEKQQIEEIVADDFIGYAIIKTDRLPSSEVRTRIYESVVTPSRFPNNFIRGMKEWRCTVFGNKFYVRGYLYAQQNNLTNVCAHVALRTVAANYHREGDMSYREMNNIVGIDHESRKVGGSDDGLTTTEMVKILEAAGAKCITGNYFGITDQPINFQKYLYGSIESGFPAIVIFSTSDGGFHAIPVIGHTFNEDIWVPKADISYFRVGPGTQYIPSESWMSMFIAHDDNWGSNFCIPRRYLHSKRICKDSNPLKFCPSEGEGVAFVISTMPTSLKINPIQAEVIGADFLFSILNLVPNGRNKWSDRLKRYAKSQLLVLRPILVTNEKYVNHLSEISDWSGNKIAETILETLKLHLQDNEYWLIELSVPELFSANRRKVGEILVRSDVEVGTERNLNQFVMARLPETFVLRSDGDSQNPTFNLIPSQVKDHVDLYS